MRHFVHVTDLNSALGETAGFCSRSAWGSLRSFDLSHLSPRGQLRPPPGPRSASRSLLLRSLLSEVSDDDFRDRLRIVNNEIVFCLARWVQSHGGVTPETRFRYDALVRHTAAFLAAGMVAPVAAGPRAGTLKSRRKTA